MLDAEADRLAAELTESTGTLEAMQMRSAAAAQELAADLAPLRLAFRKRCRAGFSNAVRLACALTVLETEAYGAPSDGAGGVPDDAMAGGAMATAGGPKRACVWMPPAASSGVIVANYAY